MTGAYRYGKNTGAVGDSAFFDIPASQLSLITGSTDLFL
jgi:hypothetical protein